MLLKLKETTGEELARLLRQSYPIVESALVDKRIRTVIVSLVRLPGEPNEMSGLIAELFHNITLRFGNEAEKVRVECKRAE